jgi:hypothetical protein
MPLIVCIIDSPGAGRKPPMLAGRDRDLEGFQALIERLGTGGYERSPIYSGLKNKRDRKLQSYKFATHNFATLSE